MISPRAIARAVLPASTYDQVWRSYHAVRRIFAYPTAANLLRSDYDTYWDQKAAERLGQLSRWRLRRAQVFAGLLSPGDRVIDLGVGDGAILRYLVAQKPIQAFGLDVAPAAVRFCREQGLDVALADVAKPLDALPAGSWDYAILSEILEHLPNPEQVVDGLRGRVRKGLLVSIPNTGFISHRLRLLLGRFPLQWIVHPGEHLRFWTLADFTWWAERLDFSIAARYPYEGVPLLRSWWPSLFAAGIVYVLEDARHANASAERA